ncbi:MAG TPA: hypothetical protein ENF81_05985 [Thermotogaceae bacterium]|nr:hypothetical protein [Thermotogaceae bacterium]
MWGIILSIYLGGVVGAFIGFVWFSWEVTKLYWKELGYWVYMVLKSLMWPFYALSFLIIVFALFMHWIGEIIENFAAWWVKTVFDPVHIRLVGIGTRFNKNSKYPLDKP